MENQAEPEDWQCDPGKAQHSLRTGATVSASLGGAEGLCDCGEIKRAG